MRIEEVVRGVLARMGGRANAIGEVQEASEISVRVKLNAERLRSSGIRPSLGDFLLVEGEGVVPVLVIASVEIRSNVPLNEFVLAPRGDRERIYYEPPAIAAGTVIAGYLDLSSGLFSQELPAEVIFPDDQVFYMGDLREAVLAFHTSDGRLRLLYLPRLLENVSSRDVVKAVLSRIVAILREGAVERDEFVEAVLESFKLYGKVSRNVARISDALQVVDEVWR